MSAAKKTNRRRELQLSDPEYIQGLSNVGLCMAAEEVLERLTENVKTRRGRELALERCTQFYLIGAKLAERLGSMQFQATVRHEEDEDEEDAESPAERAAEHVGMAEVVNGFDEMGSGRRIFREWSEAQKTEKRAERLSALQDLLDYFFRDTSSVDGVLVKLLAITRRLRPQALARFGLSQADVGRRIGGVGRATVSAREKRLVEKPLKQAGAKGVLGNGARGAATSAACARAAKGNRNRRGKSGRPTTPVDPGNPGS